MRNIFFYKSANSAFVESFGQHRLMVRLTEGHAAPVSVELLPPAVWDSFHPRLNLLSSLSRLEGQATKLAAMYP